MICTECGAEKTMRRVEDPATGERDIRWVCGRCEGDPVPPHPDPLPQEERGEKRQEKDDRYFVKALADGLSMLESFETVFRFRPASLDEIAKSTGLHKAKAYRMLSTLSACGLVESAGGGYALSSVFFPRLSRSYQQYLEREAAKIERKKREFAGLM